MLGNLIKLALVTFVTNMVKNIVYRIMRMCFGDDRPQQNGRYGYYMHMQEQRQYC